MALIKCPECGKDVSTRAAACPNCGYPISSTRQGLPAESTGNSPLQSPAAPVSPPLPAPSQGFQWGAGCFGVLVLCLVGGWLANSTGIFGDTAATPEQAHSITKAEWLEKGAGRYSQYARVRMVHGAKADEFKRFMGEPNSTQTVGDQAVWYYTCS